MKRTSLLFSLALLLLIGALTLGGCAISSSGRQSAGNAADQPGTGTDQPGTATDSDLQIKTPSDAVLISEEKAKEIALTHAGLTADQVQFLRVEQEYDDGRPEYSIEFRKDRTEYDYEIHAETGAILSAEKDLDD